MNRSISLAVITLFVFPYIISCGPKAGTSLQSPVRPGVGWIDENTYRIIARGKSIKTQDKAEKIESAQRAAVKNARLTLRKRFNLFDIKYNDLNSNPTMVALAGELTRVINSGRVIDRYYNSNTEICEVLYEIKSRGLKKKVEAVKKS